jgi:hypothetical protein
MAVTAIKKFSLDVFISGSRYPFAQEEGVQKPHSHEIYFFDRRKCARSFSFSSHEYDMISVFCRLIGSVTDHDSVKNFGSSNVTVHLMVLLSTF